MKRKSDVKSKNIIFFFKHRLYSNITTKTNLSCSDYQQQDSDLAHMHPSLKGVLENSIQQLFYYNHIQKKKFF